MVNYCAIVGCSNTGGKDDVSFFRLPKVITIQGEKTQELSERRRRTWLTRISRDDLTPKAYPNIRVCSDHFVKGKPSPLYSDSDVDWAPTLQLGHQKLNQLRIPTPIRAQRIKERNKRKQDHEAAMSLLSLSFDTCVREPDVEEHIEIQAAHAPTEPIPEETGISCQTDMKTQLLLSMESELNRLTLENGSLKRQLESTSICEDMFRDDDEKVKLFTGLPSFAVLFTLFSYIAPSLSQAHNSSLTKFQQMMLVLMRLKMNLPVQYLADKFGISTGTVSKVFANVLHVLFMKLSPLVYWPDREELRKTMPMEFRKYFGLKVVVIIDCFEIFIERPSNLMARAQTWSSYKHHNTVKYLIGIAPQGVISFISKGYGGRASDKFITNDSGLLNKLVYGDMVLADRGFDVAESVAQASAELKIPAFTKGKSQLSALDVEQTRKIAHVRIHVERVIGLVRNKYKILHDTLPLDYLQSHDGSVPTIDKIVTVCCSLTNMCKSVVPFN